MYVFNQWQFYNWEITISELEDTVQVYGPWKSIDLTDTGMCAIYTPHHINTNARAVHQKQINTWAESTGQLRDKYVALKNFNLQKQQTDMWVHDTSVKFVKLITDCLLGRDNDDGDDVEDNEHIHTYVSMYVPICVGTRNWMSAGNLCVSL